MASIKRLLWVYLAGLAACFALSQRADAHYDGDYNADGHRYRGNWGTCGGAVPEFTRTPQEMIDNYIAAGSACGAGWAGAVVCGGWVYPWPSNNNAGYITVDTTTPKDCGGGTSQEPVYESHCAIGQNVPDSGGGSCSTTYRTPECDSSTYPTVAWVATSNPTYFNYNDPAGSHCLWERLSTSGSGPYNVTYRGSGWLRSDGDDWCTGTFVGSSSCTATMTPPGAPPAAAPGEEWPFSATPGLEEEAMCVIGRSVFTTWPYDSGGGSSVDNVCMNTGCRANVGEVSVCLVDAGYCGGTVIYNGEVCDGTEDAFQGTDAATGPDSGAGSMSGVEQRLEQIYDRLGTNQIADAVLNAATVAAVVAAGNQITDAIESGAGGGGECTEGSCEGTVPTLGAAPDVATQAGTFMGRIEAAPIVVAFSNLGGEIPEAACPSFSSDPIALLEGDTLTITAACDLWEDVAPILGVIMMVIYISAGAFIILRA